MTNVYWVTAVLVLLQTHRGTWLVSYPETHAVSLAVIILVGLFQEKRVNDLPRVFCLKEPARTLRSRKTDELQSEQSGDKL